MNFGLKNVPLRHECMGVRHLAQSRCVVIVQDLLTFCTPYGKLSLHKFVVVPSHC